jgi:PAS domain-containing protein
MQSKNGIRKSKSLNAIWDHHRKPHNLSSQQVDAASRLMYTANGARDSFGECTLAIPYVELGINADDIEFSFGASQASSELPPPCRFVDTRRAQEAEPERESAKAIVSLQQPHKILTVSKELCALLGYSADELCGRSIKIFQGPRTDASFFHSAIKNAALLSSASQRTFIYGRDGQEHEVSHPYIII